MLTCRRLFQRSTDYLTFRALLDQPPLDVREHRSDVSDQLAAVFARALERDPEARYPTVRELGTALIDALAVARPWTQSEISELVRTEFAGDLSAHNAEVSRVLKRPDRLDRAGRQSIPMIPRRASEPDASDHFALDTDPVARAARNSEVSLLAKQSGLRSAAVGQSQSLGSQVSAPSAPPPAERVAAAPPPRSSTRATIAVLGSAAAVLAIGLFALGRSPARATAPAPLAATATAAEPAHAEHARSVPSEPYGSALRIHEPALDQCARDHVEQLPTGAKAVVVVGVDGHPRQIALQPANAERTELGSCIRGVLRTVAFPAASDEKQLALALTIRD
jgi:hypothetical protein